MQKVETENGTMEVFENDIDRYLHLFQEENEIESLKHESQAVWNSCLRYIYTHVFKQNSDVLKYPNTFDNHNMYNYELLTELLDYYILNMCMKYDKEVSILGFSILTGIDNNTIDLWGNDGSKSDRLSTLRFGIYKKLNIFREESLSNKLATGNKNPVGILAILNRHYQWNLPGVSKETAKGGALSAAELPKLGGKMSVGGGLLADNSVIDADTKEG